MQGFFIPTIFLVQQLEIPHRVVQASKCPSVKARALQCKVPSIVLLPGLTSSSRGFESPLYTLEISLDNLRSSAALANSLCLSIKSNGDTLSVACRAKSSVVLSSAVLKRVCGGRKQISSKRLPKVITVPLFIRVDWLNGQRVCNRRWDLCLFFLQPGGASFQWGVHLLVLQFRSPY